MQPLDTLFRRAVLAACCVAPLAASADGAPYTLSGHVDLVSKYVLRGATTTYGTGPVGNALADAPESSRPALQWGADLAWNNGFYVGYWASMINYSYLQLGRSYADRTITDFQKDKSIENDLYGGYAGTLGDFSYDVGMTAYVYYNSTHSNAIETKLGAGYGPFKLNAQTLLQDTVWGNRGDTYWTLNYAADLPYAFRFTASLGYYSYKKEGKYFGTTDTLTNTACLPGEGFVVNGCYAGGTPVGGAFRHLIVGVTRPVGDTGFSWGLTGIVGGKTRFGIEQDDKLIASLSYGF